MDLNKLQLKDEDELFHIDGLWRLDEQKRERFPVNEDEILEFIDHRVIMDQNK